MVDSFLSAAQAREDDCKSGWLPPPLPPQSYVQSRSETQATTKPKPVRILVLEGGGIKGLVQVAVLEQIEAFCGKPISQLFDLIIGTSTGGVGALHATYADPLSSACAEYRISLERVRKVFAQRSTVRLLTYGHACPVAPAEDVARSSRPAVLYPQGAPPRASGSMAECSIPRVPHCCVLTARRIERGEWAPYLLRNYEPRVTDRAILTPNDGDSNWAVPDQLLATSAAPTHFRPFTHADGTVYVDAAILVNNPSAMGLHEARCLWPDRPIDLIVSVGCGHGKAEREHKANEMSLAYWLKVILGIAVDTNHRVDREMRDVHLPNYTAATGKRPRYVRIDPEITEVDIAEYNVKKLDRMQKEVTKWIHENPAGFAEVAAVFA